MVELTKLEQYLMEAMLLSCNRWVTAEEMFRQSRKYDHGLDCGEFFYYFGWFVKKGLVISRYSGDSRQYLPIRLI